MTTLKFPGYSLTLGRFDADEHLDVMVGMPRGANLTGKVLFLSGRTMGQLHNVTGSQVGAYFGHAVAVCDVNGDGYEDAIIGAPLHTNYDVPGSYETGRVYVVYQNSEVSATSIWLRLLPLSLSAATTFTINLSEMEISTFKTSPKNIKNWLC